jgi:hypothetical protein
VAVIVDDARWRWRGSRWAHLVSDRSHEELHEFARRLGARRLGFQGDHYDVDEVDRARAVELGAETVGSRELVRRLRGAGLRDRTAKPTWQRLGEWPSGVAISEVPADLHSRAHALGIDTTVASVGLFVGRHQRVLLCDLPATVAVPAAARSTATGPRADGLFSPA